MNHPRAPLTQQQQTMAAFAAGAVTAGIIGVIARAVIARRTTASQSQSQPQSQLPASASRGSLAQQLAALAPLTPTPSSSSAPAFRCHHPLPAGVSIRLATASDRKALATLMRRVASQRGGLAREVDEVTDEYIEGMMGTIDAGGLMLLAVAPEGSEAAADAAAALAGGGGATGAAAVAAPAAVIGVLKASRIGSHRCFRSVLSDCTLAVLPPFQNRKLAQHLFSTLFVHLSTGKFQHVQRVELIARESNRHALDMYVKVGFQVQAKLCRRILSGMPLHISDAEANACSASLASPPAAPASAASASTAAAAASGSDFTLHFESDIVMVWFNPAFDLERLKDQFRRPPIAAATKEQLSRPIAASVGAAPPVGAAAKAAATVTPVVTAAAAANPSAASKSSAVATPAPVVAPSTAAAAAVVSVSPAAASSSSPAADARARSPPRATASVVAAAASPPVAAPVAAGTTAASAAVVPADPPAAGDSPTSALLASGLRLQSELAAWVRLVASTGDEAAPMASATVVGEYDAMLVRTSNGLSDGDVGGAGSGSGSGRVKFFRLRILRCAGFYSCVTHWGMRGSSGGAPGGSVQSLGQTSVTSTGLGLDAAEDAFARKYYQKTGQHWEERMQFKPQDGKYCLVPLQHAQPANSKPAAAHAQSVQSKANAKQKK